MLAVHHPPYSLDGVHGGYPDIGDAIDRAARASGRTPDIVFSGHVHSYQRFTRTIQKREIPYIIVGAGGYAHNAKALHKVQRDANKKPPKTPYKTTVQGVTLASYNETEPGFMRITVNKESLTGEYFLVPFEGDPPAKPADAFTLNWQTHQVTSPKG